MDCRPIGIFDSGLGGLTTVRELQRLLPSEQIVYFGDTGRVPYGTRSRETIRKYARQDIRFLLSHQVKMIIIACNTVAAALAGDTDFLPVPFAEALTPAVHAAVRATRNGIIGLIGTKATVQSGAYERTLQELDPSLQILPAACPLFVPLVENGYTSPDNPVTRLVAEEYLAEIRARNADTLILGCTHYPIIQPLLQSLMGSHVTLIDSGQEAARSARDRLFQLKLQAPPGSAGGCRYFVSDSASEFQESAEAILGHPISGTARQIDIEEFPDRV